MATFSNKQFYSNGGSHSGICSRRNSKKKGRIKVKQTPKVKEPEVIASAHLYQQEDPDEIVDIVNNIRVKRIEGDYFEVNDKKYSGSVFRYLYPELAKQFKAKLQADNTDSTKSVKSGFGLKFPKGASKGDVFLRVDYLPNRLYKYNGQKWIEIDKSKTDSYSYDEAYILFLIDKLSKGEYDLDQLTDVEQDLVAEKLQQLKK